jgi:hypothetical protein
MKKRLFINRRSFFGAISLILTVCATSILVTGQTRSRRISGVGGSAKPTSRTSNLKRKLKNGDDEVIGVSQFGALGIDRKTSEIMQEQEFASPSTRPKLSLERELDRIENRKQNSDAPAVSSWVDPDSSKIKSERPTSNLIHTVGSNFIGATLTDTGAFPPDSMGAVGPSQFVVFVNGRLRTFSKATGVADGVLNVDPDVFFSSVRTPVGGSVVLDFTSDPQVRYDRFTGRWIMTIIDVPCTNATCTTTAANRILIAISDAGSSTALSGGTVWTFFQFQADPGTNFCDYPSLGVDVNALYIGCNMFSNTGSFVNTNGYVIQKSSILGAGPIFVTSFANLLASSSGPFAPRGVDNYDSNATTGYFVGVDNATFSTIMFRRVSNPGSLLPTISGNISVTVPTTTFPNRVEHAGNTGGLNGGLDSLDDRLFQAMIRNGRLWTAHNFRVSSAGVANTATQARNGVRWYEFQNLTTTPTVFQSGTVFDNSATRAASRQYWLPSVTVTGQGHSIMGMTMAGTPVGATPVYVGRLAGDALGTMTGPPTTAAVTFGTTTANYNPPSDPGGAAGRRWGDYSFTGVDPLDDMTVWTIQEYNQASNSYATQVAKLLAPPPATPFSTDHPSGVSYGLSSVDVIVNGTSVSGSGFYDPGADLAAPARPFSHISASVTGGVTVNSVTYISPTQVKLNISTVGAFNGGTQDVTIMNPDGQSRTGTGLINILLPTAAPATVGGRVTDEFGRGVGMVSVQISSLNGAFSSSVMTNAFGYFQFDGVPTGVTYIITPRNKKYSFSPDHMVYTHLDQVTDLGFRVEGR